MFKNLPVSFDNNILVFPTIHEIRLKLNFFPNIMPCLNKFVYISTGQVKNKDKLLKVDGKSLSEDQPESNNWETEMLFPIRKKLKGIF